MSFSRVLRRPLVIAMIAELAVAGVLGLLAWWALRPPSPPVDPAPTRPADAAPHAPAPRSNGWAGPIPSPPSAEAGRPSTGPLPGLRTDPVFIGAQLGTANRDEAALERGEWNATRVLTRSVRVYLQGVVLPAIQQAQRTSQ